MLNFVYYLILGSIPTSILAESQPNSKNKFLNFLVDESGIKGENFCKKQHQSLERKGGY
jgi:hypothetical protein